MKTIIILFVIVSLLVTLVTLDQYFITVQDEKIKESDWVKNCKPAGPNEAVPLLGLYNNTHGFDLGTCTWYPSDNGNPGLMKSLYISFVEPFFIDLKELISQKELQPHHNAELQFLFPNAYAQCIKPLLGPPGPCFDSFGISLEKRTEKSIMENYANRIEQNFGDWKLVDRNWDNEDDGLVYPVIICTAFVVDDFTHYRMFKWVDDYKISNFEDHRDDSLCDKWYPLIDDEIKVTWDKKHYESDGVGIVTVIDNAMNLNNGNMDSFDIRVWSDIDHTGIDLTVTETENNSGTFKGTVFFTIKDKSSGARLLVEDAVKSFHKGNQAFSRIIYGPSIDGFVFSDPQGNVKQYPITELDKIPCEDFMSIFDPEMLRTEQRDLIGEKLDSCLEQSDGYVVSHTNTPIIPIVGNIQFPLLIFVPVVIALAVLVIFWRKRK